MAHDNIKMDMGNRALATYKQHGLFFYKPFHQFFGPSKIIYQLRCMLKNIKQENP